jgi:hypothetical protein
VRRGKQRPMVRWRSNCHEGETHDALRESSLPSSSWTVCVFTGSHPGLNCLSFPSTHSFPACAPPAAAPPLVPTSRPVLHRRSRPFLKARLWLLLVSCSRLDRSSRDTLSCCLYGLTLLFHLLRLLPIFLLVLLSMLEFFVLLSHAITLILRPT